MSGTLIVLEGTDGSGKSTQFHLLTQRLEAEGVAFRKLVFPQYSEPSSALIRMYLNGEFGRHPGDVNAYAATAFYAVDRYASFQKVWRKEYEAGGLILSDRYTTSNAVHQGSKLAPPQRRAFFHYLRLCRETGQEAAAYFHWHIISCDREGALRPISEIHQDIYNLVQTCLKE